MIIKNWPETPEAPIPPTTLSQAGTFSIATSKAWESKAMMGSWWVNAGQVSKTTSSGDILAAGAFLIDGEKNHLAPGQLLVGFGVIFQVTPESIPNHTKFRVPGESNKLEAGIEGTIRDASPPAEPPIGNRDEETESDSESQSEDEDGRKPTNPLLNSDQREDSRAEATTTSTSKKEDDSTDEEQESDKEAESDESEQGENDTQSSQPTKDSPAHQKPPSAKQPSRTSTPSVAGSSSAQKSKAPVRGKRGKAKKLANKYKHQDEEDRELALRLLGSAAKPTTPSGKTKEQREAEIDAQKQRRKAQHEKAAQAEQRRQKAFFAEAKQGQEGSLPEEDIDLSSISSLVGTPVAGDEIIAAIPVCAPWSALGQYKYRAKLQPGSTKKGKIVKEVLGKWIYDASAAKARSGGKKPGHDQAVSEGNGAEGGGNEVDLPSMELELIRGWRDVEIVNTVPIGKARIISITGATGGTISAGGGADIKGKGGKGGGKKVTRGKGGGNKSGKGSKKR